MKKVELMAGFTTDPHLFLELGVEARQAGFEDLDCVMPYPVHGFEEAYGFKGSWIGIAAFIALLTGWAGGFGMQVFMHSISYPINVGGKPFVAWPAFIPVTFECGILLAGLTTVSSLFLTGKLFPNPAIKVIRKRCTNDLFAIIIPLKDSDEKSKAEKFLKKIGISDYEAFDPDNLSCCSGGSC